MSKFEEIQTEVKEAMLNKNTIARDCLRSLVSDIKNQTVNAGKELTDEIVLKCVQKAVKQHDDSIEQFKAAGRTDLLEKELKEKEVLAKYLPKMLDEAATEVVINQVLQNVEAVKKNFGLIMKQLPKDVDKKIASKILGQKLK